jgi:L-ornithine N5-monooxygenase
LDNPANSCDFSVNEIFDPSRVTPLYNLPADVRQASIKADKATNYGVVRLELIEKLYWEQYEQRLWLGQDETQWPHRILDHQEILGSRSEKEGVVVRRRDARSGEVVEETYDAIVVATGYRRDMYKDILKNATEILPKDESGATVWNVGRDYGLHFKQGVLGKGVGIWLQGCCEFTHGVSLILGHYEGVYANFIANSFLTLFSLFSP